MSNWRWNDPTSSNLTAIRPTAVNDRRTDDVLGEMNSKLSSMGTWVWRQNQHNMERVSVLQNRILNHIAKSSLCTIIFITNTQEGFDSSRFSSVLAIPCGSGLLERFSNRSLVLHITREARWVSSVAWPRRLTKCHDRWGVYLCFVFSVHIFSIGISTRPLKYTQ